MAQPEVLAAGPAALGREAAVKVAEILEQLREQATSANGTDGWDQVSIPTLLDCCGFVAPIDEGPEDQSERQIRALNTLGNLSGNLSPSRREVFQRSARLYMTDSWGWTEYEADHTVKNVCRLLPTKVFAAQKNGWCDINKIAAFKSPPALIGDLITEQAFVMMYGPYSSGKTFISLDMALSVATGTPWHGAEVRQGAAAYVLGEGRGGIGARVAAWREAHAAPSDTPFRLLPQAVDFSSPAIVTDLLASIATWTAELRLLVIDTMFRCFVGNENSPEDVGAFVSGIDQCRQETGCAVLLLHHPGHNADRSRGHSSLEQALDQVIRVERNKDSGLITMSCDKNRDGLLFGKRQFRLSPRAESMTVETAEIQLTPTAEAALAALHKIAVWDGASHAAWYKATGQSNGSFNRALKVLQDGDYLEKTSDDQYQLTDAGRALLGVSS